MAGETEDASTMLWNTPERLNGTGTTEDTSSQLTKGANHTLFVGATAIRVTINGVSTTTGQVATTDVAFAAYGRIDWKVVKGVSDYVHIEAADGSSAYEAWVMKSSPGTS